MAEVFEEPAAPLEDAWVERLLSQEQFWALAAFVDDRIVGGLTAHTLPMTTSASSELFLYDLAVVPEWQRKGVGRALVTTLRQQAAAQGITVMFVPADVEDTHAIDFYRALGGAASPVTMFTFGAGDS